jgi:DNA-binding transcriptional LysR family regulator
MRIRQLQTFCDLAETLNYTHTAARLHYAQSSVIEQVRALEDHFGVRLVERDGRQLRLTDAGQQLRTDAVHLVQMALQLRERVRSGTMPTETLAVLAPETFCQRRLPSLLRAWRAAWPDVQVSAGPASRAVLASAVEEGRADAAVMLGVPNGQPAHAGAAVSTSYLASEELLLVARTGHPLAGRTVTLAKLAAWPLYATETGCAYRAASDAGLAGTGMVPALACGSIGLLLETVATSDGFALLPRMAVESELGVRLCALEMGEVVWPRVPLVLRWRPDAARPHVAAFAAVACELI